MWETSRATGRTISNASRYVVGTSQLESDRQSEANRKGRQCRQASFWKAKKKLSQYDKWKNQGSPCEVVEVDNEALLPHKHTHNRDDEGRERVV